MNNEKFLAVSLSFNSLNLLTAESLIIMLQNYLNVTWRNDK